MAVSGACVRTPAPALGPAKPSFNPPGVEGDGNRRKLGGMRSSTLKNDVLLHATTMATQIEYKEWHPARVRRETQAGRRWWFRNRASNSKQSVDLFWADVEPTGFSRESNRFSPLDRGPDACARLRTNERKVQKIVKLLGVDQSLKPVQPVPSTVPCGSLRKAVRSMYPPELSLVQELSIKTSAKAEVQPCTFCENLQEEKLDKWERERYQPRGLDVNHLDRFANALRGNIPIGWDRNRTAYVPNGHASLGKSRCKGGNWNETPFSDEVEVQLVHSSGKPRVVTLYSSRNVAVLTPLHNSLYSCLQKRGWLLVGSPTDEKLRQVRDGTEGSEWLSFDYESATDNIKTAYVRRAVDILIDQAVSLSDEEVRSLRVFSELRLSKGLVESGQPMGSPMSFPLLCLINKTAVDLAMSSILMEGKIRVKEWTRHRCLINGDDLLTRSTSDGDFVSSLTREGGEIGLKVNLEKTMRSERDAEINSTAFRDGRLVKKTNVAALWMGSEVEDVLGFADDSAATADGFRAIAEGNESRLSKAEIKVQRHLPFTRKEQVCRSRRLKAALNSRPDGRVPNATNLFPVVPKPHGYGLTHREEVDAINSEVVRLRANRSWTRLRPEAARLAKLRKERTFTVDRRRSVRDNILRILKYKSPAREDRTLSVLARAWHLTIKERLVDEERCEVVLCPPSDFSRIESFRDSIKAFQQKRELGPKPTFQPPCAAGPSGLMPLGIGVAGGPGDPFLQGLGFVSLTDG
nr:MAG: RNA-dependent RNA polymerase [Dracophyllum associated botourmia-like virus 53]